MTDAPAIIDASAVRWPAHGLVAGIVQDAADGRVLMLGWLDREALEATLRTGLVHFHSRSRGRLWRKGETSGNELRLVHAAIDCDADALLLTVRPSGPACHTGTRSCFDEGTDASTGTRERESVEGPSQQQGFAWLEVLWSTIADRAWTRPEGSYTTALLAGGVDATSRKVMEEATEVVLAAKDHAVGPSPEAAAALTGELADLLFHVLVLCTERGLPAAAVLDTLRERNRSSGP